MSERTTTVVCLWGGPGSGKSTTAAGLFYKMKLAGLSVELVREYVKDWAWEGRKIHPTDQVHILGEQYRREAILYGKVDYIVTDSPYAIGAVYAKFYGKDDTIARWTQDLLERSPATYRHFLLQRSKPYTTAGRNESESIAIELDGVIAQYVGAVAESIGGPDQAKVDDILQRLGLDLPK